MRSITLILLTFLTSAFPALAKEAPERFAAIAVVEASGEILHMRHMDALRHPASLTKIMTLYMVFEAIEAGDLGWDDSLRVSAKAATAHPSKLGLKAGTTISVENAVRALVTKSANDAAIVLAERLGGGEARFAARMTKKAKELGMKHSHFVNASGLHDTHQLSTARDMALLAYRIHHDFPAQFRYFSLTKMVWHGRDYGNHNTLLGRIEGVDGLKTGFTNASGYNLAITAERNEERLIIVVFGAASGAQRDAYATALLEKAFATLALRRTRQEGRPPLLLADLNDRIPVLVAGLPGEADQGAGGRRGLQIVIDDSIQTRPLKGPASAQTKPDNTAPQQNEQWGVQVGAYSSPEQAAARLDHVSTVFVDVLKGNVGNVIEGRRNGQALYRVRYLGLAMNKAKSTCAELNAFGQACFAVSPQSLTSK